MALFNVTVNGQTFQEEAESIESIQQELVNAGANLDRYTITPADTETQAHKKSIGQRVAGLAHDTAKFGLLPLYSTMEEFNAPGWVKGAAILGDAGINAAILSGYGSGVGVGGKTLAMAGGAGAMAARGLAARAFPKVIKDVPIAGKAATKVAEQIAKTKGAEKLIQLEALEMQIASNRTKIRNLNQLNSGMTKGKKGDWSSEIKAQVEANNLEISKLQREINNWTNLVTELDFGTFSKAAALLPNTPVTSLASPLINPLGGAVQRGAMYAPIGVGREAYDIYRELGSPNPFDKQINDYLKSKNATPSDKTSVKGK